MFYSLLATSPYLAHTSPYFVTPSLHPPARARVLRFVQHIPVREAGQAPARPYKDNQRRARGSRGDGPGALRQTSGGARNRADDGRRRGHARGLTRGDRPGTASPAGTGPEPELCPGPRVTARPRARMVTDFRPCGDIAGGLPIVLMLFGRLPQIVQNQRQGHAGQLALITYLLNVLGGTARVFTTLQELGDDKLVLCNVVSGLLQNAVILSQILTLGPGGKKGAAAKVKKGA